MAMRTLAERVASPRQGAITSPTAIPFGPADVFKMYAGLQIPDPITFVVGEKWLDRSRIYPRQATLLKIIFLRDDLFTPYDNDVIDEWIEQWNASEMPKKRGIVPDVRERITKLKAEGAKWFREVLFVIGRRGSKGHMSALSMSYVLWHYMAKSDPQEFYGIDRDKKLACLVFAGKREQAKSELFGDVFNVITGAPCFEPYVNQANVEKLSVYAPHDFVRMQKLRDRGIYGTRDMATFELKPKESTGGAGRGPASFLLAFDEMAHVVSATSKSAAKDVYDAAKPSLDQFKRDAFLIAPSSPASMTGQFFENFERAVATDEETGEAVDPQMLAIEMESWDLYEDWERAHLLPMFPPGFLGDLGEYEEEEHPSFVRFFGAIQEYDDEMRREEKANPETFAVERRGHWATALDAYLNFAKVQQVFQPWLERPEHYGPPLLEMQTQGIPNRKYKAHGDPALVNCRFGFALGHPEVDAEGTTHCVIDVIHYWDPQDFEDDDGNHIIDYDIIRDDIWRDYIKPFCPDELTFDQWNSASTIQWLGKKARSREEHLPKPVMVFEKTATHKYNWARWEVLKASINMGWLHAPAHTEAALELQFLESPRPGVVDHPTSGPVTTKDIADCIAEVTMVIVGQQASNFLHSELRDQIPGAAMQGGLGGVESLQMTPPSANDYERIAQLSNFGRTRRPRVGDSAMRPTRLRTPRRRAY